MEYKFKNSNHFLNFALKWCDISVYENYDEDDLHKCSLILKSIYNKNKRYYSDLAKDILDNNPTLTIEYLEKYISLKNKIKSYNKIKRSSLKDIPNLEYLKYELKSCNKSGIYVFHDIENDNISTVFYIGYSNNLQSRVISSLSEKIDLIDKDVFYVSIIDNYNDLDSALLEIYLINKHNPILNKGYKFNQKESKLINEKEFITSNVIEINREKWKTNQIFTQ